MTDERRPVICVDFDGVLASWDDGTFYDPGPMIPGADEFLENLSEIGDVLIWTCRTTSSLYDDKRPTELACVIWDWLDRHGLRKFVHDVWIDQGKPYAACYIDDKGIECDAGGWDSDHTFDRALIQAKRLCSNGKQHPNMGAKR